MSKLISGKEALIALANGEEVENWNGNVWWAVESNWQIGAFTKTDRKFRIKPKTTILNGVEVGQLASAYWHRDEPNMVKLEFNNPEDATYFNRKALEIFNFNKGCEK